MQAGGHLSKWNNGIATIRIYTGIFEELQPDSAFSHQNHKFNFQLQISKSVDLKYGRFHSYVATMVQVFFIFQMIIEVQSINVTGLDKTRLPHTFKYLTSTSNITSCY